MIAAQFDGLGSLLIIPNQFGTFTGTGSFRQNFVSAKRKRKKVYSLEGDVLD